MRRETINPGRIKNKSSGEGEENPRNTSWGQSALISARGILTHPSNVPGFWIWVGPFMRESLRTLGEKWGKYWGLFSAKN